MPSFRSPFSINCLADSATRGSNCLPDSFSNSRTTSALEIMPRYGRSETMASIVSATSRILNVADTIDAMVSERPYRGIISSAEVVRELEKESGRQFDPRVAESAKQLIEKGLLKLGMHTYYHYATGTDKNAHDHKNTPDKV